MDSMHVDLSCGQCDEGRSGIGKAVKWGKASESQSQQRVYGSRIEGAYFASLSKCLVAAAEMPPATARWRRKKAMMFCWYCFTSMLTVA